MTGKILFFNLCCIAFLLTSCNHPKENYDATGTFETTEIIVSSETQGKIQELSLQEGDELIDNQYVGYIDSIQLQLQKEQLIANNKAVSAKNIDIVTQIASLQEQIAKQKKEKNRFEDLYRHQAATQKQVDDIDTQLKILERDLQARLSTMKQNNEGVSEEARAVMYQIAALSDHIRKCRITSPAAGIVLTKYAEAGEYATPGKPLFKIGDMKYPFLRAYITSDQLSRIKLNQEVDVVADFGDGNLREYNGIISWIGDKAEFTPKSIQTRNERANLVYPVKIRLENDGYIKLGMYGGVRFKEKEKE